MANINEITDFLDDYFNVHSIPDSSNNGLQVEGQSEVTTIGLAVDASLEAFQKAKDCQLIVTHHGLSWGDSLKYITGLNYRRISFLIKNNINLYSLHHPLDIHAEVGHGAKFFDMMGWKKKGPFGMMDGLEFGFEAEIETTTVARIAAKIEEVLKTKCKYYEYGPKEIRRVGFVSGGGSFSIEEAGRKGMDLLITGERSHVAVNSAKDLGVNIIFAGHYRTEIAGIVALGNLLKEKFNLNTKFIECSCDL
ncbi:Nif3-like dinuclear metal center hexameric protein [Candidatus Woesearchaeota archaeon]|nr:Nif3-like dinuclear metal center hexameric protein [Candidatus Woesearchaeota archaeon]